MWAQDGVEVSWLVQESSHKIVLLCTLHVCFRVYVCVHVKSICVQYMFAHTYLECTYNIKFEYHTYVRCTCTCNYISICRFTYIYIWICTCICIYIYIDIYKYVCVYIYIYVHTYVYICIYMRKYTCIHAFIYMYTWKYIHTCATCIIIPTSDDLIAETFGLQIESHNGGRTSRGWMYFFRVMLYIYI